MTMESGVPNERRHRLIGFRKARKDPDDAQGDILEALEATEAGVADLLRAYDHLEGPYFEAVRYSAMPLVRVVTSNSATWVADADLG